MESSMNKIHFTKRELEVVRMLSQGFNNRTIAEILNISTHTVKANLEMIYSKFEVNNRVQAVIKAIKGGFVDLDDIT